MRRGRRTGAGVAVVAAAVAAVVVAGASPGTGAAPRTERPAAAAPGPELVRPAFVPGRGRPLERAGASRWAPVRRAATARARPGNAAPPVATLTRGTPEGTTNLVAVLGSRQDASGRLWIHVRLPVLPNDRTGWVPRAALGGYEVVHTHLDVDLGGLQATLLDRGRVVLRAPIGVGRPQWPTPKGRFYIRNRLTDFASPTYGPVAFGTSARSRVLTDWPGGGFIGIHGTDEPGLLPGRVSHGCIRLRNADLLALDRRMPVGTPVTVH